MTGVEALRSARYVTVKNHRFVVVDAEDWEALLEWLETIEDIQAFQESQAQLDAAGGDPERAGWLRWEDVRDDLA
jgi:PHD/YefM family antitoxin component YafN of YafNO toxin-antitoxin module